MDTKGKERGCNVCGGNTRKCWEMRGWNDILQVGIFWIGSERCLRTLSQHLVHFLLEKGGATQPFPNILYISCWKREEGNTALQTLGKEACKRGKIGTVSSYSFPTSCTFLVGKGRGYTTLSQHLVHFLLEKGGRGTQPFSQHLVHFLLEKGGATQLYEHFEKARKEQAKRGSLWIGTAPLYLVWKGGGSAKREMGSLDGAVLFLVGKTPKTTEI